MTKSVGMLHREGEIWRKVVEYDDASVKYEESCPKYGDVSVKYEESCPKYDESWAKYDGVSVKFVV